MGRIGRKFSELRKARKKALIIYITAGDPDLENTGELIAALDAAGADILEIGVPFSDPTADGPTIQAASQRALKRGTTLTSILDLIGNIRTMTEIPIVLFGYYNPIFYYGPEVFAKKAKAAGVDAILVVDLPPEESGELRQYTNREGIDFISLVAPTTSSERIRKIAQNASGFLYYVSITGVTGTKLPQVSDVKRDMERIREKTRMPVVVGFGISTPQQAAEIAPYADGIVIGSAFVRLIEEHSSDNNLVNIVASYAKDIKRCL